MCSVRSRSLVQGSNFFASGKFKQITTPPPWRVVSHWSPHSICSKFVKNKFKYGNSAGTWSFLFRTMELNTTNRKLVSNLPCLDKCTLLALNLPFQVLKMANVHFLTFLFFSSAELPTGSLSFPCKIVVPWRYHTTWMVYQKASSRNSRRPRYESIRRVSFLMLQRLVHNSKQGLQSRFRV